MLLILHWSLLLPDVPFAPQRIKVGQTNPRWQGTRRVCLPALACSDLAQHAAEGLAALASK